MARAHGEPSLGEELVREASRVARAANLDALQHTAVLQLLQHQPAVKAGRRLGLVGFDASNVVRGGGLQKHGQGLHLKGEHPTPQEPIAPRASTVRAKSRRGVRGPRKVCGREHESVCLYVGSYETMNTLY